MATRIHNAGFTLLELMITLAVAGVLAALAVPAMRTWLQNQRLVTAASSMVLSLNYARNEAVKRDSALGVTVCASADQATCGTANWNLGWIVLDVASNTRLNASPPIGANMTFTEAGGQAQVTFLPTGATAGAATFAFKACDTRGAAYARELEVNSMGRIATSPTPGQTVAGLGLACP